MNPAEILTRSASAPDRTTKYGLTTSPMCGCLAGKSQGAPPGAASRLSLRCMKDLATRCPAVAGIAALAPVSDLLACHRQGPGGGAADDLLGGGPEQRPQRYAVADPPRMIPLGVTVRIVTARLMIGFLAG